MIIFKNKGIRRPTRAISETIVSMDYSNDMYETNIGNNFNSNKIQ